MCHDLHDSSSTQFHHPDENLNVTSTTITC